LLCGKPVTNLPHPQWDQVGRQKCSGTGTWKPVWHFDCSETGMNKTYSQSLPFIVRFAGVFGKVWSTIKGKFEVPVGYQDETGFHYGKQPAQKKSEWPPV
jgi:hypothetical protein